MTLHIGSNNIVDIRHGSQKIKKVYHGSDLVWGYVPGKVLFEKSVAGTYTLYVKCRCKLQIWAVGGGGGGDHRLQATTAQNWWYDNVSGGSGGYIQGTKEVYAGTYTLVVGAGKSGLNNGGNTTVFGETAGGGKCGGWVYGGAGGTNTTSLSTNRSGNAGSANSTGYSDPIRYGGAAVYGSYGTGGDSHGGKGADGYIKVVAV